MNILRLILLTCILAIPLECLSKPITLINQQRQTISAEFLSGDNNKYTVVLLHGLLQTNNFSTVQRIASTLNELDYDVLSPTLSLGIDNRKQSLSCEAIHTHSMDTDTAELKQWIDWIYNKTGKEIILIGHSAAGPVILSYMNKYKASHIKHSILISLSYYASGPSAHETKAQQIKAKNAIKNNQETLDNYSLNYCKSYPTFPKNFLSYYEWGIEKINKVINKYKKRISIIIGTSDKRIDSEWRKYLQDKHGNVISIDGANHFFDKAHEFDLNDAIENILEKTVHITQ